MRSTAFYRVLAGDPKRLHDLNVGKMETKFLSFVHFAFKNIL